MRAKRAKVQSQSLAKRIAGFSMFGFGVSWKAPEPERSVVRDVITMLEDRRALYQGATWEQPEYVVQSIFKIRDELTNGLKRVGDNSPAKDAFRAMRAACREFLTPPMTELRRDLHHTGMWQQEEFLVGLGKLRATFGQQLAILGYLYGVDIEPDLASILPPESGGDSDREG